MRATAASIASAARVRHSPSPMPQISPKRYPTTLARLPVPCVRRLSASSCAKTSSPLVSLGAKSLVNRIRTYDAKRLYCDFRQAENGVEQAQRILTPCKTELESVLQNTCEMCHRCFICSIKTAYELEKRLFTVCGTEINRDLGKRRRNPRSTACHRICGFRRVFAVVFGLFRAIFAALANGFCGGRTTR